MSSTDTITLLVVLALGLLSSGFSSSELSSSEGAGTGLVSTGTDWASPEGIGMLDRLGILFGQSLHICWFGLS